jgi:hypothetical protein
LDPAVVAGAEDPPVHDQRGADGDAALSAPLSSLLDGHIEESFVRRAPRPVLRLSSAWPIGHLILL